MSVGKTFAFHSYKGGTGKTTLVTNLAAIYAMMGMRVCLLDLDMYAPSLSTYFRKTPKAYLNSLLTGEEDISNVLIDVSSELGVKGKLFLGLSSPRKDDINEIEIRHDVKWQLAALRRFLSAKKMIFSEYNMDYIFIDTSPGIRYWSINALAAADILFLLMKNSDMDIEGTKNMIKDIYESLIRFGSKFYLILNKVPGASPLQEAQVGEDEWAGWEVELEEEIGAQVIGSIPCFCDIQFSRHEFLFGIKQPKHPFSKRLLEISKKIRDVIEEA